MVNPLEDIAAVATALPIQPTNIRHPVTFYSNKPRLFNQHGLSCTRGQNIQLNKIHALVFRIMFGSCGVVSTIRLEKAFTVLGFKDWKHGTGKYRI